MRFVCDISNAGNTVARMSCDPRDGETSEQTADRAKASLLRDAYRHGREVHPAIEAIAEEYHRHVSAMIETGEGASITVIATDAGEIFAKLPGRVTMISDGHPWTGIATSISEEELVERANLVDMLLNP